MSKKEILAIFLLMFTILLSMNASASIQITKEAVNDVIAIELTIPAKYDITIKNSGIDNYFEFVTLLDATILPKEKTKIPAGESLTIPVTFLPNYRVKYNFFYEYFVRDDSGQAVKDNLYVKILPLSKILSITIPVELTRNDVSLPIKIKNNENINLGNTPVFVNSEPIISSSNIVIAEKSDQTLNIPLENTKIKITEAGNYKINITFFLNNEYNYTIEAQTTIKEYSEILEETKIKRSFFGYTKTITRKNNGNLKQLVGIEYNYAHFLEKTFTDFSIAPMEETSKKAMWQKQLSPGETFTIIVDTNYTVPIVIVALIVIAIVFYVIFKRKKVIVSKKAIRIRTKNGEFAVKVVVLLKNIGSHEVTNLSLTDKLPLTTKIYEKFGTVKPDEVEKHRLSWKFPALLQGEEIVVSYIIYSKINMIGTIELPQASLHFSDIKGKRYISNSNKLLVHAG